MSKMRANVLLAGASAWIGFDALWLLVANTSPSFLTVNAAIGIGALSLYGIMHFLDKAAP